MRTYTASALLLLATVLSGCAASGPSAGPAGEAPAASATAAAEPDSSPSEASQVEPVSTSSAAPADSEPTTLKEALQAAKQEHTDYIKAIGAMEDLYRQGQETLEPHMTTGEWSRLELVRIKTSLGALNDNLTEQEVIAAVHEYAAQVQNEGVRLGVI